MDVADAARFERSAATPRSGRVDLRRNASHGRPGRVADHHVPDVDPAQHGRPGRAVKYGAPARGQASRTARTSNVPAPFTCP